MPLLTWGQLRGCLEALILVRENIHMLEKIDPLRDFVEVNLQVDAPPETALTDEQLDKLGELLMPGGGGLGRERVGEFFDPEPVGVCRGICM